MEPPANFVYLNCYLYLIIWQVDSSLPRKLKMLEKQQQVGEEKKSSQSCFAFFVIKMFTLHSWPSVGSTGEKVS